MGELREALEESNVDYEVSKKRKLALKCECGGILQVFLTSNKVLLKKRISSCPQ